MTQSQSSLWPEAPICNFEENVQPEVWCDVVGNGREEINVVMKSALCWGPSLTEESSRVVSESAQCVSECLQRYGE